MKKISKEVSIVELRYLFHEIIFQIAMMEIGTPQNWARDMDEVVNLALPLPRKKSKKK